MKALRERTGAGMMECKKALVEANGDLEAAAEAMRKSGLAKADKKAGRVAAEGVVVIERGGRRPAGRDRRGQLARPTSSPARTTSSRFAADVAKAALAARPADLDALLAPKLASRPDGRGDAPRADRPIGENIGVRRFEIVTTRGPLASLPARQPHRHAGG